MILALLMVVAHVNAQNYDYKLHGSDWPDLDDYCYGKTRQSPIDLS